MLTRSMLYHRKPLFYLFIALLAAAIAAGVWLLVRPPVRNAENQAIPSADQPYSLTIISGQNEIQVPGHMLWYENRKDGVSGDGVPISPRDMASDIEYLTLDPDREGPLPFIPYIKGKEAYGQYRLYDEAFEEIPFFVPSGLNPQTYLFHGCGPGRYIVSFETSFEEGESIYGYRYFFGVIVTEEDKIASAPTPQDKNLTIALYQDGEYVHSATIDDEEQKQIVTDAIFNYMIKSAAWEAVDIDRQEDRIVIRGAYDTDFYVFDLDGQHCMQSGRDGRYAFISDEVYAPLYELITENQK